MSDDDDVDMSLFLTVKLSAASSLTFLGLFERGESYPMLAVVKLKVFEVL